MVLKLGSGMGDSNGSWHGKGGVELRAARVRLHLLVLGAVSKSAARKADMARRHFEGLHDELLQLRLLIGGASAPPPPPLKPWWKRVLAQIGVAGL